MKAIVLHEFGAPSHLKYEEHADPKPGAGEVLIAVMAVSVNPIDWKVRSGAVQKRMPVELPWIPGRDVAGIVREVGEGVTQFAAGDHVMALTNATYAQLCVVKASDLAHIPDAMDMTTAAAIPLVAITGDMLVRDAAKVQPGQTILLSGAVGSVGRMAAFAAFEIGAKTIAGVRKSQLAEARALPGVIDAVDLEDDAAMERLGLVDAVANTLMGAITEKLLAKIKQGGTFGSVADTPPNAHLHPSITVTRIMAQPNAATIRHYAEAVLAKKIDLPIERILQLKDAAEAQHLGEKGGLGGKIVLTVESDSVV
jgi:NADPH:quinone reductase-like Zn-dependent oxidoreductase